MPAKDVFHDTVRNALEKERWTITDDPLFIKSLGIDFYGVCPTFHTEENIDII